MMPWRIMADMTPSPVESLMVEKGRYPCAWPVGDAVRRAAAILHRVGFSKMSATDSVKPSDWHSETSFIALMESPPTCRKWSSAPIELTSTGSTEDQSFCSSFSVGVDGSRLVTLD